jgi:succinate dehydrogenase / fumarate reductase membrane anchor subunit
MFKGTSIGRVRGLGSAREGAGTWLRERLTGAASLLTAVFLLVSLLLMPNYSYDTMHDWIVRPVPATAIGLLVISFFWHTRLGLKVVIEDYQADHSNKLVLLLLLDLVIFAAGAFGLFCVIRLALGGA